MDIIIIRRVIRIKLKSFVWLKRRVRGEKGENKVANNFYLIISKHRKSKYWITPYYK